MRATQKTNAGRRSRLPVRRFLLLQARPSWQKRAFRPNVRRRQSRPPLWCAWKPFPAPLRAPSPIRHGLSQAKCHFPPQANARRYAPALPVGPTARRRYAHGAFILQKELPGAPSHPCPQSQAGPWRKKRANAVGASAHRAGRRSIPSGLSAVRRPSAHRTGSRRRKSRRAAEVTIVRASRRGIHLISLPGKRRGELVHKAQIPQKRTAKIFIAYIARTDKGVGYVLPGNADRLRRKRHAGRLENGAQRFQGRQFLVDGAHDLVPARKDRLQPLRMGDGIVFCGISVRREESLRQSFQRCGVWFPPRPPRRNRACAFQRGRGPA